MNFINSESVNKSVIGNYQTVNTQSFNNGFVSNVGYSSSLQAFPDYQNLFSVTQLTQIQNKITELLRGVANRPILVPFDKIASVINSVASNGRPNVGDIYSRYILPDINLNRNDYRDIIDRTIEVIVTYIRNEYEINESNQKLTVWNSLYGDFNKQGLRAHAPVKIRQNGPARFQFNMNY
jgi:hypothetical protein